ncbi:MAG: PTS sugar transporter subunit IIA [Pirellulales bacterium]|nr:PTS sugar transporter subunit IIA [Pirellulales bacterium]
MDLLGQAFLDRAYVLDFHADSIEGIIDQALDMVVACGKLPVEHRDEIRAAILDRERLGSTAIGHSVSVPHVYADYCVEPAIVFIRLAQPIDLGAPDGIPTRFVFVLLGPKAAVSEHIDALMDIARLMSDDAFRYQMGEARDLEELLAALHSFEERNRLIEKPRAAHDNGLISSGKLWCGIIADLARRLPVYASDFRDGLHFKTVSSALFLFFACIAPAITFGGIMAELTGNHIGPIEMILGTAVCGILYALLAGQPLIILGGTGPMLVFTMILYNVCTVVQVPFLETYACVGLWTGILLLVMAATNASSLLRFFTRFTDEIFSALISIIFIVAAIEAMVDIFSQNATSHATSFLSFLLALGTFYLAMSLSRFRRSRYLHPRMREFLADFGPAIAISIMALVAFWFREEVLLDYLPAPDTFRPTIAGRSWFVNPLATKPWIWIFSFGLAIPVTLLVYIDQNITARLVNSRDNRLQKGSSYHYDLAIMGFLIGICSLFGLPWLVAATVRSLNHVRSLATVEEVITPFGDKRERIIHVRENRLSGLAIHILIALSLLVLPYLTMIPMAVLYGLFLYMGIVSMAGNQFFERLSLWLMDRSLYPSTHYIRRVPRHVIHWFTFIQLGCLCLLGAIELHPMLGILFPLFLVLLVPFRHALARFFKEEHLAALDAEEEPEEEAERFL